MTQNQLPPLDIQPELISALQEGAPVVALESTVITHGLPYPSNIETALGMEEAVRQGGAIPATLAVLNGQVKIGLTIDQVEALGQRSQESVRKCSRRDLPIVLARGETGSTTVAGTMILARAAGIDFFATGGIGGVHQGHPFDVSADLIELGRTPVMVVSSGAKSILDLPATCEVLETQGVPILGFGTDELPSFFSRGSGLPVTQSIASAEEAAAIWRSHRAFDLANGVLVTVPVPEADALPKALADQAIARAIAEADAQGIHGPAATPWLLSRLVELTDGQTMQANIALLKNNGFVAGQIAKAYRALI